MQQWLDVRRNIKWHSPLSGIIHLVDRASEHEMVKWLQKFGFRIIVLEGRTCTDRNTFFTEVAAKLGFPDYFGKNWDAFHDSFGDFCYLSKYPVAIVWRDADIFSRQSLQVFLDAVTQFQEESRVARSESEPLQVELFWLGDPECGYTSVVTAHE